MAFLVPKHVLMLNCTAQMYEGWVATHKTVHQTFTAKLNTGTIEEVETVFKKVLGKIKDPAPFVEPYARLVVHVVGHGVSGRLCGEGAASFGEMHDVLLRAIRERMGGDDTLRLKIRSRDLIFMFSCCFSDTGFMAHTTHDVSRTLQPRDKKTRYPVVTYDSFNLTAGEGAATDINTLTYLLTNAEDDWDLALWTGLLYRYADRTVHIRWVDPIVDPLGSDASAGPSSGGAGPSSSQTPKRRRASEDAAGVAAASGGEGSDEAAAAVGGGEGSKAVAAAAAAGIKLSAQSMWEADEALRMVTMADRVALLVKQVKNRTYD
jgi:hypothetical protein